jgi:spore coat polysaccharide biosynthesis predicted glycosyltransferase SpsG
MRVLDQTNSPRILLVCRGSSEHGLGHIMRARTVATWLAQKAIVHLVAFGDAEILVALLRGREFEYTIASEHRQVVTLRQQLQATLVVFDTVQFSEDVLLEMKSHAKLVSISPAFNCQRYMDVVFHRTECLTQELQELDAKVELRRGLQYVVLRETCHRISEETYSKNLNRGALAIAISMGGVDAGNNTLTLLSSISQISTPMLIWVLLGEGYSHSYQALVECVNRTVGHEIILAKTTDSLWHVLETCSVGILAGGITTYEAAYAGLPTINILHNDRGPALVNELVQKGIAVAAGPPFDASLSKVNEELMRFEQSRHLLLEMHRRTNGLIDHQGAERIANEIHQISLQNGTQEPHHRQHVIRGDKSKAA